MSRSDPIRTNYFDAVQKAEKVTDWLFYLNAPSNGEFHRYPVDCWRFYPDAGGALGDLALDILPLAVQPIDGWRELWVFRHTRQGWQVLVQPPAALLPGVGYAEFAGWVPGGQSMLVAREAVAEGRTIRRFEVVGLDNLIPQRTAFDAESLGPFNRWADARGKRLSLAMR